MSLSSEYISINVNASDCSINRWTRCQSHRTRLFREFSSFVASISSSPYALGRVVWANLPVESTIKNELEQFNIISSV